MTLSGTISFELIDPDRETCEVEVGRYLRRLDGIDIFSVVLWKIPAGKEFSDVDLRKYPKEYIQAAGSRDRMAAEIRRQRPDGSAQQLAIGRASDGGHFLQDEIVPWSTHQVLVQKNEVLDVEEVVDLFAHYYRDGDVPSTYSLREFEL